MTDMGARDLVEKWRAEGGDTETLIAAVADALNAAVRSGEAVFISRALGYPGIQFGSGQSLDLNSGGDSLRRYARWRGDIPMGA